MLKIKYFVAFALIAIVLLAGCPQKPVETPEEPPAATEPEPLPQQPVPEPPSQPTTVPAPEPKTAAISENDGDSGGDSPNKFVEGQIELKAGEYTSNGIAKEGDIDFYKFTVGAGDYFKVTVTPTAELDTQILIYDAGGKDATWDFTYYTGGNTEGDSTFKINSGIAGKEEGFWSQMSSENESYTHYFSVNQVKGLGNYTIQLEVKPQDDAESGKDSGEKPAKAVAISSSKEYGGYLNWNDVMDCYKLATGANASVTVSPTETINVSFTVHDHGGKDATWDLTYYKKTNKAKSMFSVDDADAGIPEEITWQTTGSTQYICVKKKNGFGSYTISYS